MCKLTKAQPKGYIICFENDNITPLVLCLKILFIKNRFVKDPVPELIKKSLFATVKRYVDDLFVYNFKA